MTGVVKLKANAVLSKYKLPLRATYVTQVPVDIPPPDFSKIPGKLTQEFVYHHANGLRAFHLAILQNAEGKNRIVPAVLLKDLKGYPAWYDIRPPDPRPLYNLPSILTRKDDTIIVARNEIMAEAFAPLVPEYVVTTWMLGNQDFHMTDFRTLIGRKVILLKGPKGISERRFKEVSAFCFRMGVKGMTHQTPRQVVNSLGRPLVSDWAESYITTMSRGTAPPQLDQKTRPECKQAIDTNLVTPVELATNLDVAAIKSAAQPQKQNTVPSTSKAAECSDDWLEEAFQYFGVQIDIAENFGVTPRGIIKHDVDRQGRPITVNACSPLVILGRTVVGEAACEWGYLVGFRNPIGIWEKAIIPARMFAGDGKEIRELLGDRGVVLPIDLPERKAMMEYIAWAQHARIVEVARQPGWHKDNYLLPEETISPPGMPRDVVLDMGGRKNSLRKAGTKEAWQTAAKLAESNSRAALALMTAFAGPLLRPLHQLGGGIHLHGASSTGKTSLLILAGSVWGGGGSDGFARPWRMTTNGAEGLIADHNDLILPLDELTTVTPEQASELFYMLANGHGKARAKKDGSSQDSVQWSALVLSSGEHSAEQQLKSGRLGKRSGGGLTVRMIDVPIQYDEMQSFEELGPFESSREFVNAMKQICRANYGHAGPAFVRFLLQDKDQHLASAQQKIQEFISRMYEDGDDAQVERVATTFGLIAAAGHLAVVAGVLPWAAESVDYGVETCFKAWRDHRGGGESEERRSARKQLAGFFEAHGASRFEVLSRDPNEDEENALCRKDDFPVRDRCGYRVKEDDGSYLYFVLPNAWEAEVCDSHDHKLVETIAAEAGALWLGENGRKRRNVRLPDYSGTVRVVAIRPHLL